MAESLGRAVFDLELNDSAFQAGLKRAEQGVRTYTDSAGRLRDQFGRYVKEQDAANQSLGRFNREAGNQAGVAGLGKAVAGLVAQLGLLAVAAKAFDQIKQADDAAAAVRTLGVNSVELGNNLQLVSASLRANVSTLELTKAAYDVASAGFADAAQATDVLKASALGAKGGFSTINTVADAATSVLNAYGLAAREAGRIVDGFITTQNDGKIVVDQYAAQIGKLAPIAAAAGVSISELNAAISAATAQGVPVEATFSGLRQVISSILKPTQEATELADRLGITFNAQALQAQGLGQFLQQVAAKTKGSADANAVLFGSVEALTAVQPLLNDQLVKYNQFLDNQRNSAGAAAAAASTVSETISSGITAIGNAFSNLLTSTNFSSIGVSLGGLAETINSISLTPAQQEFAAIEQAIAIVTQEIERRKEYGLDTSIADRRLAELERRANVVRQAVGEQTNVEALKAEAVQLGKQAEALKRSGLDAAALNTQLGAIGNEIAALEGRDITFNLPDGTQIAGFVNDALKGLGDELQNAEVKLNALQKQRTLAAPGVDTTQLDGDIATIESKISRIKGEIKIEAERTAIDKEIKRVQGLLNNPINFERFFVKGFGGPEAQKALKERLTGLQQEKQILEQVVNQNAKAAQEKQKGTANQQRTNEEAKAGAAQAAAAAVAAKQAEVAVRNEKLKTLNSERTLYKQQETRLGLYAQETQLVGQIAAARNQAALDRSNTIKSLLD
ncbi:MAG: phage tail tape measure protein, partial [Limnohabitans sp.]